jgi:hypothetical protein
MTAIHQESRLNQQPGITTAIEEKRVTISLSQLMGCDYIFITANQADEFFTPELMHGTIEELINLLDTIPRQTVVILVDDQASARFTRHDVILDQDHIQQVTAQAVISADQIEFMEMMLDCSTLY